MQYAPLVQKEKYKKMRKDKMKKGSSNCFLGKGHKAEQPTCNGQMNTMWGSSLEQSPNLKLSL